MGIWDRIKGIEEKPLQVKAAVIGEGPEAERLAAAYSVCPGIELVHAETVVVADGVIRTPVVRVPGLTALDDVLRTPGLQALEIVAPLEKSADLARASLRAGVFTSIPAPVEIKPVDELVELSRAYRVPLRVRLLPLYYPPYREFKRLLDDDTVGHPISLKLMTRWGKGAQLPRPFDPVQWIREHDLGFLSLATWLLGPIEKVHIRTGAAAQNNSPATSIIMWKYRQRHQYGFLQLDICPDLHVRTFTDPVHRSIELTGAGGLILATRGEGQLLRLPALMVRGKSTTTAFELIPDDWREVYKNLALETLKVVNEKSSPRAGAELTREALRLAQSAHNSLEKGDEVALI